MDKQFHNYFWYRIPVVIWVISLNAYSLLSHSAKFSTLYMQEIAYFSTI